MAPEDQNASLPAGPLSPAAAESVLTQQKSGVQSVKRITTQRFGRLQYRKASTADWEDLEESYVALVDKSAHDEPANVQRVVISTTGMVVNQYGAEFPSKLTEPLHGWQVNFTNDKISNLMLEEYGKPERRFCVIRFKCTGPPESRETTSSPRGTAAMGVDGQADDLPLAKLCQQPGDVVGMEFRLAIPKGSTRPDKVNAWLWPMIVSFLMSAPWQVVSDEVSRGSLDQWARGSSSRPRGATLKEVPYSARPEWTLQRQAGTLAFNYRNAQARPPGPSKRPVQQPREQAHAEPQPQQQEKASGVPVNRPRAEDSLEALMAELERTKSGFVAAALRRQETDEKLKAAQREHNQTAKEAKEWATRFSAAQAALASYDDERARSKKQG